MLSHFDPFSERETCELIFRSPTKSCMLDPIPTSLTKQCLNDFVPFITLSTGTVTKQFKQRVVMPLLKKPAGLSTDDLEHFRPVPNLSFISKVLGKIVLKQLQKHICGNSL